MYEQLEVPISFHIKNHVDLVNARLRDGDPIHLRAAGPGQTVDGAIFHEETPKGIRVSTKHHSNIEIPWQDIIELWPLPLIDVTHLCEGMKVWVRGTHGWCQVVQKFEYLYSTKLADGSSGYHFRFRGGYSRLDLALHDSELLECHAWEWGGTSPESA